MHHSARIKRGLLALVAPVAVAGAIVAVPAAPAAAASHTSVYGVITKAYQYRNGTVNIRGYAFDRAHRNRTVGVCLTTDGKCFRVVYPHYPSPTYNKQHHLSGGGHRFNITVKARRAGAPIVLRTKANTVTLDRHWVSTPGNRVVGIARKYVGNTPYSFGGSSPRTGFDCSGYAMYSYRTGNVASLPHNANTQRHAAHMRTIPRSTARPGDLVFYLSNGYAYHVAIYAGHNMQYSAADPSEGIKYQRIWARNIRFMTNWH